MYEIFCCRHETPVMYSVFVPSVAVWLYRCALCRNSRTSSSSQDHVHSLDRLLPKGFLRRCQSLLLTLPWLHKEEFSLLENAESRGTTFVTIFTAARVSPLLFPIANLFQRFYLVSSWLHSSCCQTEQNTFFFYRKRLVIAIACSR